MHFSISMKNEPFFQGFEETVGTLLKRLHRVFVHVYFHHFDVIQQLKDMMNNLCSWLKIFKLNFFFASLFRMMGEVFWKWKFLKIMTPKGFWPKLFFQNSCFFSNISYRGHHRGPFIGRKECIWDLLLQIVNLSTSILGAKNFNISMLSMSSQCVEHHLMVWSSNRCRIVELFSNIRFPSL